MQMRRCGKSGIMDVEIAMNATPIKYVRYGAMLCGHYSSNSLERSNSVFVVQFCMWGNVRFEIRAGFRSPNISVELKWNNLTLRFIVLRICYLLGNVMFYMLEEIYYFVNSWHTNCTEII